MKAAASVAFSLAVFLTYGWIVDHVLHINITWSLAFANVGLYAAGYIRRCLEGK